jgi:hypothetical protein
MFCTRIEQLPRPRYERAHSRLKTCLGVPHCFLNATIRFIIQFVQVRPRELVFDLGEVDICE